MKKKLLMRLSALQFGMVETRLFLDTHPDDRKALALYHKYAEKSRELKAYYNENFGPITPSDNLSQESWEWVHGPWPWEN